MKIIRILFGITIVAAVVGLYTGVYWPVVKIYEPTGYTIDGYEIVTFTDKFKKSKEYKNSLENCDSQDVYVYEIDGFEYYYETTYFESEDIIDEVCTTNFNSRQEYAVYKNTWRGLDEDFCCETLMRYFNPRDKLQYYYDDRDEITSDYLDTLDFLQTKESMYMPTGKEIAVDINIPNLKIHFKLLNIPIHT